MLGCTLSVLMTPIMPTTNFGYIKFNDDLPFQFGLLTGKTTHTMTSATKRAKVGHDLTNVLFIATALIHNMH